MLLVGVIVDEFLQEQLLQSKCSQLEHRSRSYVRSVRSCYSATRTQQQEMGKVDFESIKSLVKSA